MVGKKGKELDEGLEIGECGRGVGEWENTAGVTNEGRREYAGICMALESSE